MPRGPESQVPRAKTRYRREDEAKAPTKMRESVHRPALRPNRSSARQKIAPGAVRAAKVRAEPPALLDTAFSRAAGPVLSRFRNRYRSTPAERETVAAAAE